MIATYLQSKSIIVVVILGAALYFGWPIIEAIILVLPIPDPKDSLDRVKNAASSSMDMVSGVMSSNTQARSEPNSQYSTNLDSQPEAFGEDEDNSDEDIGGGKGGLNYDSDDKNDDNELITSANQSELIDLGGGSSDNKSNKTSKRAANIPKLSGPN